MNASLLYLHTPKTGGSTIGSLFQPHRRLYRVVPHPTPPLPARIKFYGGHRGAPMLDRLCNPKHECCVWLAIVREPLERLRSAFSTSAEDHQHFDCPRGSALHLRLRNRRRPLTLEEFARAPAAERERCTGVNALLDQLAPGSRPTAARLRLALARLDGLQLVGVQSRLGETLRLLARALGFSPPTSFSSVFTYNPRVPAANNLSARATRALRRTLAPDTALYSRALERFDDLLRRSAGAQPIEPAPPPRCDWRAARCWDKEATKRLAEGERAAVAPPTPTWPVADVADSPLWRMQGRRQRTICAAPCTSAAGTGGFDGRGIVTCARSRLTSLR